jgi:hypothetical protein
LTALFGQLLTHSIQSLGFTYYGNGLGLFSLVAGADI